MSPNGDMKPTPTEFVILKHLWQVGPQSQSEIHHSVQAQLQWSRSSTRKTIERMYDKGMLSTKDSHGTRLYKAKVKKVPTIAIMIQNFASTVLGLEGPLPVANLMKSHVLNAEELIELEHYLNAVSAQDDTETDKPYHVPLPSSQKGEPS